MSLELTLRVQFTTPEALARFLTDPPGGVVSVSVVSAATQPAPTLDGMAPQALAEVRRHSPTQRRPYPRRHWTEDEDRELLRVWADWPPEKSVALLADQLSPRWERSVASIQSRLNGLIAGKHPAPPAAAPAALP